MNVIPLDQATQEFTDWLDFKKVPAEKRKKNEDYADKIIGALSEGTLVLNDDKSFTLNLLVPFGKDVIFDKLDFLPRVPIDAVHMYLRQFKSTDADGRLLAHVAALTRVNTNILVKCDTEDYNIASAIAMYFL